MPEMAKPASSLYDDGKDALEAVARLKNMRRCNTLDGYGAMGHHLRRRIRGWPSSTTPRAATPTPSRSKARAGDPREGARPRPPRCRHIAQQPGRAVPSPRPLRRRRAALQARARDPREGARPRPPRCRARRSTTWPRCTESQGRYADAEPLYKRALAIREKALGPDHPDVGDRAQQPGRAVPSPGPLRRRRAALQARAGDPREGARPRPPRRRRPRSTTWPRCIEAQGRYADAEPLYKRALAIREKALGPDHPDVAHVAQQPGRAVSTPKAATPTPSRSTSARSRSARRRSAPTTPMSATSLNNLAELYQAQGRYAEAEPLYKRALAIREKALGPDHPDVGTSAQQPGRAVPSPGPLRRGRAALQARARDPREGARPRPPRCRARRSTTWPRCTEAQGRYADAEPLYKRALAISEKALGPDHPDVATSLNNLAVLYRAPGPLCRRRAALQARARDLGKGARPRPSRCRHVAQQPGRAVLRATRLGARRGLLAAQHRRDRAPRRARHGRCRASPDGKGKE